MDTNDLDFPLAEYYRVLGYECSTPDSESFVPATVPQNSCFHRVFRQLMHVQPRLSGLSLPPFLKHSLDQQLQRPYGYISLGGRLAAAPKDAASGPAVAATDHISACDTLEQQMLQVKRALVHLQRQIQRGEELYFQDTDAYGNIFKGWDTLLDMKTQEGTLPSGSIHSGSASNNTHKPIGDTSNNVVSASKKIPADLRWFSSSSATIVTANEGKVHGFGHDELDHLLLANSAAMTGAGTLSKSHSVGVPKVTSILSRSPSIILSTSSFQHHAVPYHNTLSINDSSTQFITVQESSTLETSQDSYMNPSNLHLEWIGPEDHAAPVLLNMNIQQHKQDDKDVTMAVVLSEQTGDTAQEQSPLENTVSSDLENNMDSLHHSFTKEIITLDVPVSNSISKKRKKKNDDEIIPQPSKKTRRQQHIQTDSKSPIKEDINWAMIDPCAHQAEGDRTGLDDSSDCNPIPPVLTVSDVAVNDNIAIQPTSSTTLDVDNTLILVQAPLDIIIETTVSSSTSRKKKGDEMKSSKKTHKQQQQLLLQLLHTETDSKSPQVEHNIDHQETRIEREEPESLNDARKKRSTRKENRVTSPPEAESHTATGTEVDDMTPTLRRYPRRSMSTTPIAQPLPSTKSKRS